MARLTLFIGGISPLPRSGRPTGIYKHPLLTTAEIGPEGFLGDQQADRRVHGGPDKAIHLYPATHYARLARQFPSLTGQLIPGSLGENLSTPDLDENLVRIGDIWRLGSARLQVCQPRNPCWKIDQRFDQDGIAAFIAEHRLTGWYWRVLTPGHCQPGDTLDLEQPAEAPWTLAEAMTLWQSHRPAPEHLDTLANLPGLADNWRHKIIQRADWLRQNSASDLAPPRVHLQPAA